MSKTYCCEKLETTLNFTPEGVRFCCGYQLGPGVDIENIDNIKKIQNEYIQAFKRGEIPKECQNCTEYKKISIKDKIKNLFKTQKNKKISYIFVNHYKQCDCSCIYCSQKNQMKAKVQNYELLPIIKKLYIKDILDKENLVVEFQGGNVSVLKEFKNLVAAFLSKKCKRFVILMNAIKYIPIFDIIGNIMECSFIISLDCGTRETYAKIKQVDAFEQTISNIKRIKAKTTAAVTLKYIIIKGVNDNKAELEQFFCVIQDIKTINRVVLDIDYNDTCLSYGKRFDVPEHYYELFKLAKEFCEKEHIRYFVSPFTQDILDKGYSI